MGQDQELGASPAREGPDETVPIKKLQIIIEGQVHVPQGVRLPVFPIRSSGGPTSTRPHIIISKDGHMVKVAIGDEGARFALVKGARGFSVLDTRNGTMFLEDIEFVPAVLHSPSQAFINIEPRCHMGCLFCSAGVDRGIDWSPDRWVDLVVRKSKDVSFGSAAITAGIPHGKDHMVRSMIEVVEGIHKELPSIPIGIEPNALPLSDLERLKQAGANELKVNVQTATQELFDKVCPRLDRDKVYQSLEDGVNIFGRGRVSSNLLIGLTETDKEVLSCLEELTIMGVAVNLRVLRINDINRGPLEKVLGKDIGVRDTMRVLTLVQLQKEFSKKNGIDPMAMRTMCHRCGCCDLTIGIDI